MYTTKKHYKHKIHHKPAIKHKPVTRHYYQQPNTLPAREYHASHPVTFKDLPAKNTTKSYESSGNWMAKVNLFISGGATFSRNSNVATVRINDVVLNEYNTTVRTNWNPIWGAGISYPFNNVFGAPYSISAGVAGYLANLGKIRGIEHPFANGGSFDTLNYEFKTNSKALMIESRLAYTNNSWQPFVLLGVGSAWNNLNGYNEVPTVSKSSATPALPFTAHTNISFAYELGLGVQREIYYDVVNSISYSASLDYRYINFGKGELGNSAIQTSGNRLYVSSLTTQGILLTLNTTFF